MSIVGFPDTPSPFVMVVRLLVPVMVLPVKVSAAVWTSIPFVLNAARAARVASYA